MVNKHLIYVAVFAASLMLASCGGHEGVELGEFPALSKTEGDAPFDLKAPVSKSPAQFTYTSSNLAVATVEGTKVTVHAPGSSTITAQQGRMGSYYPTSTSAVLTVVPRVCASGAVAIRGVCIKATTFPGLLAFNGGIWMATSFQLAWADADKFCADLVFNGNDAWKLPSQAELQALAAETQLGVQRAGQFWILADTWTSTAGGAGGVHVSVNLASAAIAPASDDQKINVTCVHAG